MYKYIIVKLKENPTETKTNHSQDTITLPFPGQESINNTHRNTHIEKQLSGHSIIVRKT